jgi:hypothetical protein
LAWDVVQVVLLFYLSVSLPLRAGFDIAITPADWSFYADMFADVFFVLDIALNFRTAYTDAAGVREERPRKVRKTPSWPRSWANFSLL